MLKFTKATKNFSLPYFKISRSTDNKKSNLRNPYPPSRSSHTHTTNDIASKLIGFFSLIIFCGIVLYAINRYTAQTQQINTRETEFLKVKIDAAKVIVASFEIGRTTENFSARPIPKTEIVKGKKGKYFSITILNQKNQIPIYFKSGEYVLNDMDDAFIESVTNFKSTVLDNVSILNARVFIQGKADSLDKSFIANFKPFDCDGNSVRNFDYHPFYDKNNNLFSEATSTYVIKPKIGNADLTFLRAKFLHCKLQSIYKGTDIEIVEGNIDPNINESSRKGTFILYIPDDSTTI